MSSSAAAPCEAKGNERQCRENAGHDLSMRKARSPREGSRAQAEVLLGSMPSEQAERGGASRGWQGQSLRGLRPATPNQGREAVPALRLHRPAKDRPMPALRDAFLAVGADEEREGTVARAEALRVQAGAEGSRDRQVRLCASAASNGSLRMVRDAFSGEGQDAPVLLCRVREAPNLPT